MKKKLWAIHETPGVLFPQGTLVLLEEDGTGNYIGTYHADGRFRMVSGIRDEHLYPLMSNSYEALLEYTRRTQNGHAKEKARELHGLSGQLLEYRLAKEQEQQEFNAVRERRE